MEGNVCTSMSSDAVTVKEEVLWEQVVDSRGVSEAAALAGLYTDHEVKEELVIGPEVLQPPDAVFTAYRTHANSEPSRSCHRDPTSAETKSPKAKAVIKEEAVECPEEDVEREASPVREHPADFVGPLERSDSLEARRGTRPVPNSADVGNQIHTKADIDTEKVYVCDICEQRFALKARLSEHVTLVHRSAERGRGGSERGVADHGKSILTQNTKRFALRDCVVRLTRVFPPPPRAEGLANHAQNHSNNMRKEISNIDIGTETYKCDICEERFPQKIQMRRHVKAHAHRDARRVRGRRSACKETLTSPVSSLVRPALRDCYVRLQRCVTSPRDICGPRDARGTLDSRGPKDARGARDARETRDPCETREARGSRDARGSRRRLAKIDAFVCDICGKAFLQKQVLIAHIQVHLSMKSKQSRKKVYTCDVCDERFRSYNSLNVHSRRQHRGLTYSCDVCGRRLTSYNGWRYHLKTHAGRKRFSCEICDKRFLRIYELNMHRVVHTGEKPFSCDVCRKRFTHLTTLNKHKMTHTGQRPYSCGICKREFRQSGHLRKHERAHAGIREHSCEICQKKFVHVGDLKLHRRIHTGEKPYSCEVCKKNFTQRGHLQAHKRTHTGERPHSCDICWKKFADASYLKKHKSLHTGERPYFCGICKKSFAFSDNLKKHERIHTGEKPYSCDICGKKFSESRYVKSHRRIRTGEKPYSCDVCEKTFSSASGLTVHKRLHTGSKPFSCKICNARFAQYSNMKTHERRHRQIKS